MPELPEVETIVRGLQTHVIGRTITSFWCERPTSIKTHSIIALEAAIKNAHIIDSRRRAKYILIDLSNNQTLLIHQKMSGHLLYGRWKRSGSDQTWLPDIDHNIQSSDQRVASDPFNRFIRAIFFLDNGDMLGLSDVRRFARIYLTKTDTINELHDIGKLGPEPLAEDFTADDFSLRLNKKRGTIKKVLMDPYVIAGIGNIYADEILWQTSIHPLARVESITKNDLVKIYKATREILTKAIERKGHSERNYRTLWGTKGSYQDIARAYQKHGQPCARNDGGIIEKIRINNRSAHFCPVHQKL